MRITAICMILLLASQAGAAIVCPAECAPVQPATAHHGHEHHMHAASATATMSAAQCSKLMLAESALASASRVPEFALEVPIAVNLKSLSTHWVSASLVGAAALLGSSPPKFTVLRI